MVGYPRETPAVRLAQLGQPPLPQLGVPRMVVAAGAKCTFRSTSGPVATPPPSTPNKRISIQLEEPMRRAGPSTSNPPDSSRGF